MDESDVAVVAVVAVLSLDGLDERNPRVSGKLRSSLSHSAAFTCNPTWRWTGALAADLESLLHRVGDRVDRGLSEHECVDGRSHFSGNRVRHGLRRTRCERLQAAFDPLRDHVRDTGTRDVEREHSQLEHHVRLRRWWRCLDVLLDLSRGSVDSNFLLSHELAHRCFDVLERVIEVVVLEAWVRTIERSKLILRLLGLIRSLRDHVVVALARSDLLFGSLVCEQRVTDHGDHEHLWFDPVGPCKIDPNRPSMHAARRRRGEHQHDVLRSGRWHHASTK